MEIISLFRGSKAFLSNMYECNIVYKGVSYKNAEAAFQAQKCIDIKEQEKFADLSGVNAKKYGKQVKLRADWNNVKLKIMQEIIHCKFTQNEHLRQKLLNTDDAYIEEANWWRDTYWGTYKGVGYNMLGKILMSERSKLVNDR